jgi:hypothetical protein
MLTYENTIDRNADSTIRHVDLAPVCSASEMERGATNVYFQIVDTNGVIEQDA